LFLIVVQILIAHAPSTWFGAAVRGILSPGFWIAYGTAKATGVDSFIGTTTGLTVFFLMSAAIDIALYSAVIFGIRRLVARVGHGRGIA
jgi:hypothetical protein